MDDETEIPWRAEKHPWVPQWRIMQGETVIANFLEPDVAIRIAAAVNAVAGIPTEALAEGIITDLREAAVYYGDELTYHGTATDVGELLAWGDIDRIAGRAGSLVIRLAGM